MYFERDVGGTCLVYIDHTYGHGDIYMVARADGNKLVLEDGYDHGRDADAVQAFQRAYGLRRIA